MNGKPRTDLIQLITRNKSLSGDAVLFTEDAAPDASRRLRFSMVGGTYTARVTRGAAEWKRMRG